jgi:hypothetical protein
MQEKTHMPPIASISNLNSRLSITAGAKRDSSGGAARRQTAPAQSSAPQVRIVGGARRYQGGYRLNV